MIAPPRRLPFVLRRLWEQWELRRRTTAGATELDELRVRIAYANLRAVLGNREPEAALRRMARRSRDVLRHTEFETEHPVFWSGFAMRGLESLTSALAGGRGAIVASAHVGPYRVIPIELAQRGFHVDVVVDRRGMGRETGVLETQGQVAERLVDRDGRVGFWRADLLDRLGVINAEAPDVAVRMVRALRANRVLMVYADGNTGAGARKAEHLERVPLLGTHVLVRRGIGEIAHLAGAPVIPAFAWRGLLRRHRCVLHPAIAPLDGEARGPFAARVLREVMVLFEARMADDAGAWEEWHHFHRMRDGVVPEPSPPASARLPRERGVWHVDSYRAFGVSDGAAHFVFEAERGRFLKTSKLGVDLLRALYRPRSPRELVRLFAPAYAPEAIREELDRFAARGWLEESA